MTEWIGLQPPADADLTGGEGREFRVAGGLNGERMGLYQVAELTPDSICASAARASGCIPSRCWKCAGHLRRVW